jgi:argininosuccinate lyase
LIHRLGEDIGGNANLARSSGDIAEVARRYTLRNKLLDLVDSLNLCRTTLLRTARTHADTVMPGYTHAQQAQPTTFGHWLAMWELVFSRDVERLRGLCARLDCSPAGAAILTGSEFPINRHRTAELLGFAAPSQNTMDAILSHDMDLETASVLAIHTANLGRLGDDIMLWSSREFAMIDVPDRFCDTSSMLAQKKIPVTPERLKALAARASGAAVAAFVVEKGPSGFPMYERRDTQAGFWATLRSAVTCVEEASTLLAAVRVDRQRMTSLAAQHWAQAADVAGLLVSERGLSWRTAHQIMGIVVRLSVERGLTPGDTTPALVDEAAIEYFDRPVGLSSAALAAALDPSMCVQRRSLYGGPALGALTRELSGREAVLHGDIEWAASLRDRLTTARERLDQAIDALVATNDN